MTHTLTPRSLRWRLPLIAAITVVTAVLAWVPQPWLSLSVRQHETLQGMAAGASVALVALLVVFLIPAARQTYFQLLEARECWSRRDRRVIWFMGIALALYVLTLLLAHWAISHTASPILVVGLGLLPLLAMTLYIWATVLHLRQLDELMRKIEMESWALSALVVSQAYLGAWVLLKAGLLHVDTANALVLLGVWLMVARKLFYVWLVRRYL